MRGSFGTDKNPLHFLVQLVKVVRIEFLISVFRIRYF